MGLESGDVTDGCQRHQQQGTEKVQVNIKCGEGNHLDRNQRDPQHKQSIAQHGLADVAHEHRHHQWRTGERSTCHITAGNQQGLVQPVPVTLYPEIDLFSHQVTL